MANTRVGLLAALLLTALTASAEPPKYVTSWTFTVDGVDVTTLKPGPLTLPRLIGWQCRKSARQWTNSVSGGFNCSSDGFKSSVGVLVACRIDKPASERTQAILDGPDDSQLPMILTVECRTVNG